MRASGQLRLSGFGGVVGIDLGAAFALGRALGYDARALAELLPAAEDGLVGGFSKLSGEGSST